MLMYSIAFTIPGTKGPSDCTSHGKLLLNPSFHLMKKQPILFRPFPKHLLNHYINDSHVQPLFFQRAKSFYKYRSGHPIPPCPHCFKDQGAPRSRWAFKQPWSWSKRSILVPLLVFSKTFKKTSGWRCRSLVVSTNCFLPQLVTCFKREDFPQDFHKLHTHQRS